MSQIAEGVLQHAGVIGDLPTPMEPVRQAAGIEEMIDISRLPEDLAAKKPPKWRRILGAMWFKEKVSFVDLEAPESRARFTDAHEAMHSACPWHEAVLRLDNEETLDGRLKDQIETEANFGAGYLIFQGARFFNVALSEQVSMRTPLALASRYGASRHATIHYYTQGHPDAVALLVAGRFPYADGTLPIWRSVESPTFRERFGRLIDRHPGQRLQVFGSGQGPLGEVCLAAQSAVNPPERKLSIPDLDGTPHRFLAEAFFNQHCYLIFVSERRVRRLGRRTRLKPASLHA